MSYEDRNLRLPRIRCPCCRGVINRKNVKVKEYTIECVDCHWKSKVITDKRVLFQRDLDFMHLMEIESVVYRQ